MIVIAAFLIGALLGWSTARSRKGSRLDMAQYAAGFGIAFAILGLFLTLLIERLAV